MVFFIACRGQTMHVALTNIQEAVYDFFISNTSQVMQCGINQGIGIEMLELELF